MGTCFAQTFLGRQVDRWGSGSQLTGVSPQQQEEGALVSVMSV